MTYYHFFTTLFGHKIGGIFFTSQTGMLDHASIYLYLYIQIDRPIDSHLDIFLHILMVSTHMYIDHVLFGRIQIK